MEAWREEFLMHHGILGQHWGRKNGPPYPLDSSDHSASEKKAGWRKSLDRSEKNNSRVTIKDQIQYSKNAKYINRRDKLLLKANFDYARGRMQDGLKKEIKAFKGDVSAAIAKRERSIKDAENSIQFIDGRISYTKERYRNREISRSERDGMINFHDRNRHKLEDLISTNQKVIGLLKDKKG